MVPPLLEVALTAITCWSEEAEPPWPHPTTVAAMIVQMANITRWRRLSLPLIAIRPSAMRPVNIIETPPAAAGNIDASLTFCNSRREVTPVPLGGVLDTVPFRAKLALWPLVSFMEEKLAVLEPLVSGRLKVSVPLGDEPLRLKELNTVAFPIESVTVVMLTVVPDGTALAVTVIVPPLEKLEPALKLCVPSVERVTLNVWARAVPQKHTTNRMHMALSQRPELSIANVSSIS
jgi:hypothetical protein